ncbi:HNH endonuclease signature motif containing protein, partial [Microbispora sp. KK1-11]|uniref:HNH endonuclease signature motif containing protein n=1 Tax=Microbispora sp. KK1-11 TaxID=2053005 RepID=UPI00115A0A1C
RPLRVRNADAFIALLEEKIATELLVLVNAESLPTDPDPTDPQPAAPGTDHSADAEDPQDAEGTEGIEDAEGTEGAEDGSAPGDTESADDPGDVEDARNAEGADGAEDSQDGQDSEDTSAPGDTGSADDPGNGGGTDTAHAQDECLGRPAHPADCGDAGADAGSPSQTARPDPPPENAYAHHAHAGHRPAGDCRHAQGTPEDHNDVRRGQCRHQPGGGEQGSDEQGRAQQDAADGQGVCGCGGETRCSRATRTPATPGTPGTAPGAAEPELGRPAGTAPGTPLGTAQEASPGALPGAVPGAVPGLLLATGQVLPVSSVHRLARTSSLVRLVMDAEGQVLDMGRKVRLATPAQRRAIFARYATCWIDGCPLPATMCQIDHADNWSIGGLTNLKLLGPACQFHNRDRYRHPDRYTRRKTGTDRWAFTYHNPARAPRLRI